MVSALITSVHHGTNADLIREVCRLYLPEGAEIADVTYGTGRFWRKATDEFVATRLFTSDIMPGPGVQQVCDFRSLPYRDSFFDVVVFDPPYAHNAGSKTSGYAATTTRYNNHATTSGMYNADIMDLYRDGMRECMRVAKAEGGQLWVKCKDEVERERQRWSHIYIYEMATELGLYVRDLFVLVPNAKPADRWQGHRQWHARKTHSYLWVFQRPDTRLRKLISKPPPRRLTGEPEIR